MGTVKTSHKPVGIDRHPMKSTPRIIPVLLAAATLAYSQDEDSSVSSEMVGTIDEPEQS
jgi:hypothetical protein